jgi:hypothetical protein
VIIPDDDIIVTSIFFVYDLQIFSNEHAFLSDEKNEVRNSVGSRNIQQQTGK